MSSTERMHAAAELKAALVHQELLIERRELRRLRHAREAQAEREVHLLRS
jgi:hypothetical protein